MLNNLVFSCKGRPILAALLCVASASAANVYTQTNLSSSVPGLAAVTDPDLVNPWGVSFAPTSPFWMSDQGTNKSTLYNASGTKAGLVVSTPGGPTGQVFNSTQNFLIGSSPSTFIFSTLSGNIEAWNGAQGTNAAVVHSSTAAAYTGLALGSRNGSNVLFAANKRSGGIDVFDGGFNPVALANGAFQDANVPAGFTPYNVQMVNGLLYVEYSGARGSSGGYVSAFNPDTGALVQHISDPHLNAPWGITMAPSGFGDFGSDLLVGNFQDGQINAFDPSSGNYLGTLMDAGGNPLSDPGLWAIAFRNPIAGNANTGSDPNSLFFVAGIDDETNGLFGRIDPASSAVPEPASVGMAGLALAGISLAVRRSRRAAAK